MFLDELGTRFAFGHDQKAITFGDDVLDLWVRRYAPQPERRQRPEASLPQIGPVGPKNSIRAKINGLTSSRVFRTDANLVPILLPAELVSADLS